jgi:tetratricopeptide (TPR) repeat protein
MIMFFIILLQLDLTENVAKNEVIFRKHLTIEKEYSIDVKPDLYEFFNRVHQNFTKFLSESAIDLNDNSQTREIFELIDYSIKKEEISIQNDDKSNLMSHSIESKSFDCDKLVFIYLSFAQLYHLNFHAVYMPGHIFLEWEENNKNYYWETTTAKEIRRDEYLKKVKSVSPLYFQKARLQRLKSSDLIALIHFNIAMYYILRNDYKNSFTALNMAEAFNQGISEIHVAKAYINSLYNNNFSAIHDYNRAIKISPYNYRYYFSRSKLYHQLLNIDSALSDIEYAIKLNPNSSELYFASALLKLEQRDFLAALNEIENGLSIERDDLYEDLKEACESYLEDDLKTMNKTLEAIIEEKNDFKLIYYLLAENYSRMNRYFVSNYYYDKVIEINDLDSKAYYFKALNYEKLDKKNLALKSLKQAIDINPNFKDAILLKKNIERPLQSRN